MEAVYRPIYYVDSSYRWLMVWISFQGADSADISW